MRVYRFSYAGYTHGWCVSPPRAAPHRRCQARPNGPPLREVFLVVTSLVWRSGSPLSGDETLTAWHSSELNCFSTGLSLDLPAVPFIPVPSYMQHLLMPAADPHWGDTLNGSLIRILVTLGHARNTAIPVTSSRTGFRALSSLPFLKHAHSWACPLTLHPSSSPRWGVLWSLLHGRWGMRCSPLRSCVVTLMVY